MIETEIAYQAAINVLRDTVESGRMPHGAKIESGVAALHSRAADHLELLLEGLSDHQKTNGMLKSYDDFVDAIDVLAIHNGDARLTRKQSADLKLVQQTTGDIPGNKRPTFERPDPDQVKWAEGILETKWLAFLTVTKAHEGRFPKMAPNEDPKSYFIRLGREAETNDILWKDGLRSGAIFTPAPWIAGSLALENGLKIGPGDLPAHNLPNADRVHIEAWYQFSREPEPTRYVIYPHVIRRRDGPLEIDKTGRLATETVALARWMIFDGWVTPPRLRRRNGPQDQEDGAGGAAPQLR
jgi:hypothetical protein